MLLLAGINIRHIQKILLRFGKVELRFMEPLLQPLSLDISSVKNVKFLFG